MNKVDNCIYDRRQTKAKKDRREHYIIKLVATEIIVKIITNIRLRVENESWRHEGQWVGIDGDERLCSKDLKRTLPVERSLFIVVPLWIVKVRRGVSTPGHVGVCVAIRRGHGA